MLSLSWLLVGMLLFIIIIIIIIIIIYTIVCFFLVRNKERWYDFMGAGDYVLYHNKEKSFEVGRN